MASSFFGIIYSPNQNVCRRIIHPGNDSELTDPSLLMPGEEILIVSRDQITGNKFEANALVSAHTGNPTTSDRSIFVDSNNNVAAVHLCDPAIDGSPKDLNFADFHDHADVGDSWNGTEFLRKYAVVNPTTKIVEQIVTLPLNNPTSPVPDAILYSNTKATLEIGQVVLSATEAKMQANMAP